MLKERNSTFREWLLLLILAAGIALLASSCAGSKTMSKREFMERNRMHPANMF